VILLSQFETLSKEYEDRIRFFQLDAGKNRDFLQTLKIKGVPTFLFYKDNKVVSFLAGGKVKIEDVQEETEKLLS
jgi:thioredoxin-like negative regulator of GroEL